MAVDCLFGAFLGVLIVVAVYSFTRFSAAVSVVRFSSGWYLLFDGTAISSMIGELLVKYCLKFIFFVEVMEGLASEQEFMCLHCGWNL